MSTRREIEAKIAAAMQDTTKRIDVMTSKINSMVDTLNRNVQYDIMQERFRSGSEIKGVNWTMERIVIPRICYASGKTLYPGTTVYKGVGNPFSGIPTVWLSREEFVTRKLKGQI